MSEPGDEVAAGTAGRSRLRASHADRELVIGTLKVAFVQGRLTKDDLDVRLGQALAARTYGELDALTTDIPAGLTTAERRMPGRAQGDQPVARPGPVLAAATVLLAGVWGFAIVVPNGGNGPSVPLILGGWLVYLCIVAMCLAQTVALRRERRSGGASPRPPAAGPDRRASPRLPSGDPGRRVPPVGHGQHRRRGSAKASTAAAVTGRIAVSILTSPRFTHEG